MRDRPSADDDDSDSIFEFEDGAAPAQRHARWIAGIIRRALPVLLLAALLLVVGGQPNLAQLFNHPAPPGPVLVTVVCDVPWATIRVDGRGAAARCAPGVAGALPMARLEVSVGQHTLLATAEGFAPYPIYAVIHPQSPGIYLTQFTLTPQGIAGVLTAVNAYFASAYTQDAIFPATLWPLLGLRQPPTGPTLLVRDRFEAVALDSYEPFYSETTYQRPVVPVPGMVGVAVVVIEHVTISTGCGAAPLLERRLPVLYATRASVTLSARPDPHGWTVAAPYALKPAAEITTSPADAASPATPTGVLALAAHAALAAQRDSTRLADELDATPLVGTGAWADGLLLNAPDDAASGAIWLYMGGRALALNAAARRLTPGLPAITPAANLDALRAALARQPAPSCGHA